MLLNAILSFVGITVGGSIAGAALCLLGSWLSDGFDRLLDKMLHIA